MRHRRTHAPRRRRRTRPSVNRTTTGARQLHRPSSLKKPPGPNRSFSKPNWSRRTRTRPGKNRAATRKSSWRTPKNRGPPSCTRPLGTPSRRVQRAPEGFPSRSRTPRLLSPGSRSSQNPLRSKNRYSTRQPRQSPPRALRSRPSAHSGPRRNCPSSRPGRRWRRGQLHVHRPPRAQAKPSPRSRRCRQHGRAWLSRRPRRPDRSQEPVRAGQRYRRLPRTHPTGERPDSGFRGRFRSPGRPRVQARRPDPRPARRPDRRRSRTDRPRQYSRPLPGAPCSRRRFRHGNTQSKNRQRRPHQSPHRKKRLRPCRMRLSRRHRRPHRLRPYGNRLAVRSIRFCLATRGRKPDDWPARSFRT